MEITKYFKNGNEADDFTQDYVKIKMSYEDYIDLFYLLDGIRIKDGLKDIQLDNIEKKILEKMRETEVKEVWY